MPTLQGYPQSVLMQIFNQNIWIWRATHERYYKDPETINQFESSGYQRMPELSIADEQWRSRFACLTSQGFECRVLEDANGSELWARTEDIAYVDRYPVILAFQIAGNLVREAPETVETPGEVKLLPMLQYVPPAGIGALGIVPLDETHHALYSIADLPEDTQRMQVPLANQLIALAGGGIHMWYQWDNQVQLASDPHKYKQALAALQAELLATEGQSHDQVKQAIGRLERAYANMQSVQLAQSKPDWYTQWAEVQHMMQDLARAYWEHHQAQKQSRASVKSLPSIPDAFATGAAMVYTPLPIQGYLAAVSNAQQGANRWQDEQGIPTYPYIKPSGRTHIQIRPDDEGNDQRASIAPQVVETLWEEVRKLSGLDGDVFLALVAHLIIGPKDERGYTWIHARQILDYRGIQPIMKKTESGGTRRAGHRQEDIEAIGRCIARMRNTWVKVDQMIVDDGDSGKGKQKEKRKIRFTREDRLFNVGSVIRANELDFDDTPLRPAYIVAWQYQEADWMLPFTRGANKHIGLLAQSVLGYDYVHEFWEKQLSWYLMFHLRINAAYGGAITRKIGDLLQELSLPIDERHPERTKQRFEKAMKRLVDDQHIERWEYKQAIGKLPARKWLETWFTYEVTFIATPLVKNQYQAIKKNSDDRKLLAALTKGKKQGSKRGKQHA